ncbi:hypothetical protein [Chryseobacterium binzhouense]|uniref:hypothetical protein n=1 Tax=Chryseobacterium binzhouense TaxID=2593646 RepID=UPI00117ECEF8|nr:hypothetical protein [Chryseobacterium binzhouense]
MKKHLFLRLCLMFLIGVSAFSCRTEEFHNEEETQGNTGLRLTSQRISLNESKHRTKLLPELQKAEVGIKAYGQKNAKGKINYVDGVSIDTDHVMYIENGPNFHTYTFHLTRQNALPTDPIENLVLIPATDGSYREMLISYNLTPQEKQMMMSGEYVDTQDKTTVTLLDGTVYNPLGAKSNQSCVWQSYIVGYTACSANEHFNGEGSNACGAKVKSKPIKDYYLQCKSIAEAPIGNEWWAGPGSGGGSGGGGEPCVDCPTDSEPEPCNGNGVSTQPVDPSGSIAEGGCEGIPTVIEFPNPDDKTPCDILKENDQNQTLVAKRDSLKTLVTKANPDKHETMVVVTKEPNGTIIYNTYVKPSSGAGYTGVSGVGTNNDIADIHNHPPGHIPIYAFGDIVNIYDSYTYLYKYRKKVFISYLVNFNGTTYAIKMNDPSALDTFFAGMNIGTATTTKAQKDFAKAEVLKIFKENGQEDKKAYNQADAEKLFMKVIHDSKIGSGNGLHIYRKDSDGWGKLNIDSNGNITKENCPL